MDYDSNAGSIGRGEGEEVDADLDVDLDDDDDDGDVGDGEANSDANESSSSPSREALQQKFPRTCLLSNCYLKKHKVFHNNEDLNRHLQRCMSRAEKNLAAPASSAGASPILRQSRRSTSVPLRVSLDYETSAFISSRGSGGSGGTSSAGSRSSSTGWSAASEDTSSSGSGSGSSGSGSGEASAPPAVAATSTRRGTLCWRNTSNGNGNTVAPTSAAASTPNIRRDRLQWSASLSVEEVRRSTGRSRSSSVAGKAARSSSSWCGRASKAGSRDSSGAGEGEGAGAGGGARVETSRPSAAGVASRDGNSTTTTVAASIVTATATAPPTPAVRAGSAPVPSWRGSLGAWGSSGGFTCPVNPIQDWGIPGCGKDSRARDSKCESCGRVLRIDWQVGTSASIGSGVENPQLKLAGVVTFQNKGGITYRGRVVAIDPRPLPGAPRGVVRVKYDDWPYDKYDEDVNTEMVTPFGWIPTPVGRAGRRASKPPTAFTPNTESYRRKQPAAAATAESVAVDEEGVTATGETKIGGSGSGSGPDSGSTEEEETEEEASSEEEVVAPPVKVWVCKHVRQGIATPVNKAGECSVCRNASLKARAGIKMCRHVREGEAKAYGRGPGNYGKGHCRECTLKRFPVKKAKVPRPRLWPSCVMPGCRRRHHAWGMCAPCLAVYKAKHPKSKPQQQVRRRSGKPSIKYTGADAEFTDSSDEEDTSAAARKRSPFAAVALKKVSKAQEKGEEEEEEEGGDTVAIAAQAAALAEAAAAKGYYDGSHSSEAMGTDIASETSEITNSSGGNSREDGRMANGRAGKGPARGKRAGGTSIREGKRSKVVDIPEEDPVCFYCQKAAGKNARDELLYCADFDCNRRVHMSCCTPALTEVPDRFYCQRCVGAGKDAACEHPCLACGSNERDDLILVCDRDKCYNYFHSYCLPQPLDEPPEGEYVCPLCTGEELERGMVIAKRSGGTRPPRELPPQKARDDRGKKKRKCSACNNNCASKPMWICASGKELCKGMMFHRKCLARGKVTPETAALAGARVPSTATTLMKPATDNVEELWGVVAGGVRGVGVANGVTACNGGGRAEAMEVRDSENYRLCCPECGYDLLKMDVVDVGTQEQTYDGTAEQEQAYKTFERALKTSLEDPRFGIGKTREEFEDPFKGSIGSGSNRTAMYGSVFESAVDLMFRESKLTARHKFLDIGCGIGSIVLQAAAWAGCQAAGIEIVEDRYDGAVALHSAFQKAVFADRELGAILHPEVVEQQVHLFKGCFLEKWENPEVRDADFIFFNNSSGWFNNSKALNNPDEHSLESRLLKKLKNDTRNNGKILITLEHIAEWQPTCWERRSYKYSNNTRRAATYAAKELEFWEYTVVSQWECPGCTSMNTDAVNDCVVCGTYCSGKRNSKRL